MINIDFECSSGHRLEGTFGDYDSFIKQQQDMMIKCPVCDDSSVRRIYRGCSIRSGSRKGDSENNFFHHVKELSSYIKKNFEDAGENFADRARAIHYGVEDKKNIYGKSTDHELKELIEDGIAVIPLPDMEKMEN